jgi:hypothetical protein
MSLLILFEFPRLGAFYLLYLYLRLHEHLQEPKEPFLLRRVNLGVYLRLGNIRHASQGYLHVLQELVDVHFQLIVKVKLGGQHGKNPAYHDKRQGLHADHASPQPEPDFNHTSKRETDQNRGRKQPNVYNPPIRWLGWTAERLSG